MIASFNKSFSDFLTLVKICFRENSHKTSPKLCHSIFDLWVSQVVLTSSEYTAAIDMWSVGCILGELMGRKVMFLAEVSAIISMNIWSFEQYPGVWHGICYIWSSCCPFCCIFSQYCRRQSLSSNVEMRLSTGLKAVTLSIKSTRFVRSWEHLRHWGVLRG